MEMLIQWIGWSKLAAYVIYRTIGVRTNWCYKDGTIFSITDAVLTTTTHAVLMTTTHAVLTIINQAVFFHTLISYKRLGYIQPPLPARRSLLHVSWVPTLSLTRG